MSAKRKSKTSVRKPNRNKKTVYVGQAEIQKQVYVSQNKKIKLVYVGQTKI